MAVIARATPPPVGWRRIISVRLPTVVALVAGVILLVAMWPGRTSLEALMADEGLESSGVFVWDDRTRFVVEPSGEHAVRVTTLAYDFWRGWQAYPAGATDPIDDGAVLGMFGLGGEHGQSYSTVLYGIGPRGTRDIQLTADWRGRAEVVDPATGAFIIVLADELGPDQITYRLLDADGAALFSGRGLGADQ